MKNTTKKERGSKKIKQKTIEDVQPKIRSRKSKNSAILLVDIDQNLNDEQSYVLYFSDGKLYRNNFIINQEGNTVTFLKGGIYRFDIIGQILESNSDSIETTIKIENFPKELNILTEYKFVENISFSTLLEIEDNQRINLRLINTENRKYIIRRGFRLLITEI